MQHVPSLHEYLYFKKYNYNTSRAHYLIIRPLRLQCISAVSFKGVVITHGIIALDLDLKTDLPTEKQLSVKHQNTSLYCTLGNQPPLQVDFSSVLFFLQIYFFSQVLDSWNIRTKLTAI